jgi:hypothetical protein
MTKKKHTSRRQRKQKRHRNRTMKGGAFTQQELQQLQGQGFNEYQIERLQDLGVSYNEVMQKVNTIMNQGPYGFHGNSDDMTEQVMVEILNEHIFENPNAQIGVIPHAAGNLDLEQSFQSQGTMNLDELNTSQGTMNLDELNTSNISNMSGYTSGEAESDDEFGGRRRRRTTKKRRGKKSKKTRKQRGGMCFGNGVGSNNFDPNNSIYNTNMLKLFPYKAT